MIYKYPYFFTYVNILYACNFARDPISSEILKFLILRGPFTAYRIAKELNLHFAQVYRKVRRMESFGLVRRDGNRRGDLVKVTPRGLVVCYYYGCVRHEIVLDKLAKLYRVRREDLAVFLDNYLETFKNDVLIDDLPVMVYYAMYRGMPHSVTAPLLPLVLKVIQLKIE